MPVQVESGRQHKVESAPMRILALETSTDMASCALLSQGVWRSVDCPRGAGPEGQHSATLLPAVQRLIAAAGTGFSELDAIAFGSGPGAFTGLRLACALAQGLAVPWNIPVVPVSSLAAMAWTASDGAVGTRILSLLDARMEEVYCAAFEISERGCLEIAPVELLKPQALMTRTLPSVDCVCGNALIAYPDLQIWADAENQVLPQIMPHARAVGELGLFAFEGGGGMDAGLAIPGYVRNKVAQTVAERLAEGKRA